MGRAKAPRQNVSPGSDLLFDGASPEQNSALFTKRQTQIVRQAARLFMEKGYAQTTMRQISRATGIDLGTLYYFIENKENILFLVFELVNRREFEMFESPQIRDCDDPLEQLRIVIHELCRYAYDYGKELLLLYRETKVLSRRLLKIVLSRESRFVTYFEEILRKGVARGVFHVPNISFTANMIAYEIGMYPIRGWNLEKQTREEFTALMEQHILRSVAVVPGQGSPSSRGAEASRPPRRG